MANCVFQLVSSPILIGHQDAMRHEKITIFSPLLAILILFFCISFVGLQTKNRVILGRTAFFGIDCMRKKKLVTVLVPIDTNLSTLKVRIGVRGIATKFERSR